MASRVPMIITLLFYSVIVVSAKKKFVLTLDSTNFTQIVAKYNFVVVEFYAPWCGHCKKLAPQYEKAAKKLSSHDPPVVLAKVDANEEGNKALAREYEIRGFPTLKIVRNGGTIIQDYKGPREADGIVTYLKKQSGPASTEIKSTEDADKLIVDNKIAVVGIFPEFSGEKFKNFTTLSEKLRSDYEFGHTLDAKHLPRGDSSLSEPTIRLLKPFDELVVDFQDFNVETLEKSVQESSLPLVTLFNKDPSNHPSIIKFFNSPDAKALLFMNFSSDLFDVFKSKLHEVAQQFKGQGIIFLMGDVETSAQAFQFYGVKDEHVPVIVIQTNDGQKYLKAHVEPDHIAPWVKDYKDGNVRPFLKSEPIPEANTEPVKVVVGETFEDMVSKSEKNVLIEFYAPWCGHCKKLAPILDEIALSLSKDPEIVIAKIDASANDIPSETFDVKGYPTLYFKSANGVLTQYQGDRTKEDILLFIQKHRETIVQQTLSKDEL
ncbi:hypothetical protein DCAR_0416544 [Daucus carota subsp. sativus]|uniref:Protein disulfide-isomerase n=1 Tax=Daucus carota subsp. sativus TaxID=79200 RepID=A0A162AA29_DAUCS|nr:PREDICTED: protein disulfide-isomerase [Daucus carota subsp. sativus]XP_017246963.1 PREDICTED: protein disulfide-isomerase [Daucus carota subsp. sativus]WOG97204.1 hypothetical protein DCAR_0416544 [Daucus carota subsp. sativus]